MRVFVLGSTGMLGSEVVRVARENGLMVTEISRTEGVRFDAFRDSFMELAERLDLSPSDYLVNCIGWIPQKKSGNVTVDEGHAQSLNVDLPFEISQGVRKFGFHWIQIGTDCVFSGSEGWYLESSRHDATDLYGKSKALGESHSPNAILIRASIIGPDSRTNAGLYSWFRKEADAGRTMVGFANHLWNGVSTTAFSKLVCGLVSSGWTQAGTFHWMPRDSISKLELLRLFARTAKSAQELVLEGAGPERTDRTLATEDSERNSSFWSLAGYSKVPSIAELVEEMIEVSNKQGKSN